MIVTLIAAIDNNNGIGKNNSLLCKIQDDLKNFKNLTKNHSVLMGRKTFESIGKALPNRKNIIISRSDLNIEGTFLFNNIEKGIEFAREQDENELFIIGGGEIYKYCLENNLVDKIFLTKIDDIFEADVFLNSIDFSNWNIIDEKCFKKNEINDYDFKILEMIKK